MGVAIMASSVMTRKGQITIPAEIRRLWNIKEGDRVNFVRDGDQVRIAPVGDVVARTAGVFAKYRREPAPTIEELKEIIADGWVAEAMHGMKS
jgi:AbrB family looped-hinge helix DNA binding protein